VLWRHDAAGGSGVPDLLVAVAHRPKYDDWSLPKGKLHPGEHVLAAAAREVAEETGAQVELGRRLASVEYPVDSDAVKTVHFWAMRHVGGEHTSNDEVDLLRWLTIAEATKLMTYPIDRGVLADFARLPADTQTVLVVRHARAGKRSDYHGDDRFRPLDKIGRRDARALAPLLALFGPRRVLSADRVRCEQTVAPLADSLGLPVISAPLLSDEGYEENEQAAVDQVRSLMRADGSSVVCSQGGAIPTLLAELGVDPSRHSTRKGSVWALSTNRGAVVAADYYPRPKR
jgi:8-oxo-dGTP diphosphatase